MFCYFLLLINSGLFVYVNGVFVVVFNRCYLKERIEDDKVCIENNWNSVLLKDFVCVVYLDFFEDLKLNIEMLFFFLFWFKVFDVKLNYEFFVCFFY